jgi:hypothetical protein
LSSARSLAPERFSTLRKIQNGIVLNRPATRSSAVGRKPDTPSKLVALSTDPVARLRGASGQQPRFAQMARPEVTGSSNDDVPLWGARRIKHLYGCNTEKELYSKIDAGVITVPKIGGRLCDTPRRAREQIARLLGESGR